MSQISPPLRILLVCALAFLAAWMMFLRPRSPSAPAAATPTPAPNVQTGAPAETGLGRAVQRAKRAAGQESGGRTAAPPRTAAARASSELAAPALPVALRALPSDVAAALKARKVLVLGVIASESKPWRPMADDDRAVRAALHRVNRYRGDVFVKRVPPARLAAYGPVLADLNVNQTPSVVVVDRDRKGTTIAGYLDKVAIDQAIVDARRAGTVRLITDRYLHRVNGACGRIGMLFDRFPLPATRAERRTFAQRLLRLAEQRRRVFAAIPAPARWQGLKSRLLGALRVDVAAGRGLLAATSADQAKAVLASVDFDDLRGLDRELESVGATACVVNRQS